MPPFEPPPPPPHDPGSLAETAGSDSRLQGSWAFGTGQHDAQRVGPYALIRELGRGSWGVVFLARRGQEPPVALKLLLAHGQANPEAQARFVREAQLSQRIEHPNVVRLLDVGEDPRGRYCAMEYVPGPTLKDYLQQRERLLIQEACELVATLADALDAAHRLGVVHRDVKPANVILEARTGLPRLTDFGLARDTRAGSDLTRTRDVIGTPVYMAPEQFSGARVDARADVYALGVILYQALCGRLPFFAPNLLALQQLVLRGDYPAPTRLRPDLPAGLVAILERALARDPDRRFPRADDLARALRGDLRSPAGLGLEPPRSLASAPRVRWGRALLVGLALGVPLHLLLRAPAADPVRQAAQSPSPPSADAALAELFACAARGVPYPSLAFQLESLALPRRERLLAGIQLAFRRGRLRSALRLSAELTPSDRSTAADEARLCAGLAATFLADYRVATATLEPLSRGDDACARIARAWLCLADDYTFSPDDYRAAIELLDDVLAREPEHLLARLCRAYFAVAKTHLEGLPYVDGLERVAPDHWIVVHLRGRGLRHDPTRAAEAAELLARAVELTGGDCEPTFGYYVQALLISDQLARAREELSRALGRYPAVGGLIALDAAVEELSGNRAAADAALARLVRTVGIERAQLELYWLRADPMGPALQRVIERSGR
ncbi:MAG: serine/threonine-protein kinase [Planctomycetota bacterium]